MSENRLVIARACGLPLTLLKKHHRTAVQMFLKAGDLQVGVDLLVGLDKVTL